MPVGFNPNEINTVSGKEYSNDQAIENNNVSQQKDYYWDANPEYFGPQKDLSKLNPNIYKKPNLTLSPKYHDRREQNLLANMSLTSFRNQISVTINNISNPAFRTAISEYSRRDRTPSLVQVVS